MLRFVFIHFIFTLNLFGVSPKTIEQFIVPIGEVFSFDCEQDDVVVFTRRLGEWSQIDEYDSRYAYINFNYISQENVLRVTINSADAPHVGYYGCRNKGARQKSVNRIYQLVLADVESFYWTYICHDQVGACIRYDHPSDKTQSTFEVADNTDVDLFCCASVTGYENVKVNMDQVGNNREHVTVRRKKDLDGSLVICASQHTNFKRQYPRGQETLTCELVSDDRPHSSFRSHIEIKDKMPFNPDFDPNTDDFSYGKSSSDDDGYFDHRPRSGVRQGKVKIGKRIGIIFGSIVGGLVVLGLLLSLVCLLSRKKQSGKSSNTSQAKDYSVVSTTEQSNNTANPQSEQEPVYLEPAPLYENSPMFFRL